MKRWAVIGLAVALVAIVGGAAYGLRWRAQYQPLTLFAQFVQVGDRIRGHTEHHNGTVTQVSEQFQDVEADPLEDDRDVRHVLTNYVDGRRVTTAYALHNGGSVGVTITSFDQLPSQSLLAPIDVRVGKRVAGGAERLGKTEPFHSFTLHPGETRYIVVRQRMHACESHEPGSSNIFEGLGVHYRVTGLNRHVDVPTPMRVEVKVPADYSCPRPRAR